MVAHGSQEDLACSGDPTPDDTDLQIQEIGHDPEGLSDGLGDAIDRCFGNRITTGGQSEHILRRRGVPPAGSTLVPSHKGGRRGESLEGPWDPAIVGWAVGI